jgi:hypothetical protein
MEVQNSLVADAAVINNKAIEGDKDERLLKAYSDGRGLDKKGFIQLSKESSKKASLFERDLTFLVVDRVSLMALAAYAVSKATNTSMLGSFLSLALYNTVAGQDVSLMTDLPKALLNVFDYSKASVLAQVGKIRQNMQAKKEAEDTTPKSLENKEKEKKALEVVVG